MSFAEQASDPHRTIDGGSPASAGRPPGTALRVAVIGAPDKPTVPPTFARTCRWLRDRCEVVHAEITSAGGAALAGNPDLLVVLGGDGTLIAAVHDLGGRQVPIVGINLGKVGYLTEFTIDELEREGDFLFREPLPVSRRVMLAVEVERSNSVCQTLAVNDCVLLSGPPYRMIELRIEADGEEVAEMRGDGLIVATASGSTAHNLSAGGPILDPTAEAVLLTPMCPHALTFRPLALDARRRIVVRCTRVNDGTALVIDGRETHPFRVGDRVTLTRHPSEFLLVRNPRRSPWYALRHKLMWGETPRNGA